MTCRSRPQTNLLCLGGKSSGRSLAPPVVQGRWIAQVVETDLPAAGLLSTMKLKGRKVLESEQVARRFARSWPTTNEIIIPGLDTAWKAWIFIYLLRTGLPEENQPAAG